jgi:hypothetical protein
MYLLKALHDEAISDNFNIPSTLSYGRNPTFVGRQQYLEKIYRIIGHGKQRHTQPMPLVIQGIGGVGKTQLVREYIFAHRTNFSSVVWINSRSLQTTQSSFVAFMQEILDYYAQLSRIRPTPYGRIAHHLGVASFVNDAGQLVANLTNMNRVVGAVNRWLEREGNDDWLLVFDNVDDLESFRISDFFPNSASGTVILTSRRPECARLGEEVNLEAMNETESVTLLSKSIQRNIVTSEGTYGPAVPSRVFRLSAADTGFRLRRSKADSG